jgi:hypothetical protein
MGILIWVLSAYGMSNILVYGSIFNGMRDSFRKLGDSNLTLVSDVFKFISELLSCMMCTSTWVGFFLSALIYSPWNTILGVSEYVSWFFDGMLASGMVWAINSVVEWFEENRPANNDNFVYEETQENEKQIIND